MQPESLTAARAQLDRLWSRGTAFLGCPYAILGGAMSWVSEKNLVAAIFGALAEQNTNVDMIVQNVSADGTTDMTFTVGKADLPRARAALTSVKTQINWAELLEDPDVAKVSVVGVGMRSHAGVANTMFSALADKAINIQVISTSEIKVSVLIAAEYTELAVRALHSAYGLDAT